MRFLLVPLLAAAAAAGESPLERWQRTLDTANRVLLESHYQQAGTHYRLALDLAAQLGPDELPAAITLNDFAYYEKTAGRLLDAERGFSRALAIMERKLGPTNRRTVEVVVNLTGIHVESLRLSRAESLLRRYLRHGEKLDGTGRAILHAELGAVLIVQRRFDEAERLMRQALTLLERDPRTDLRERTVSTLSNLATICIETNRLAGALAFSNQARARLSSMERPPAVLAIKLAANAGTLSALTGHPDEAVVLFQSALAQCEAAYGPRHFLTGRILSGYADVLRRLGRKSEARTARKKAQEILREFQTANRLGGTVDVRAFRLSALQP